MSIKPTKLEIARDLLKDSILEKDKKIQSPIHKAQERINFKTIKSSLNLPATANSAVDGYGVLHKTFLNNPKTLNYQWSNSIYKPKTKKMEKKNEKTN